MMKLFCMVVSYNTMLLYDIVHLSKYTELYKVNFNKCNQKYLGGWINPRKNSECDKAM